MGKIIVISFWIAVILITIYAVDWGFLRSELTVRPVVCMEALESGKCNSSSHILDTMTFKVKPTKQEVLHWTNTKLGKSPIDTLVNCSVRSSKNWSCLYNDESAEFGFESGKFWKNVLIDDIPEITARTYYVSRFEWLKLRWVSIGIKTVGPTEE